MDLPPPMKAPPPPPDLLPHPADMPTPPNEPYYDLLDPFGMKNSSSQLLPPPDTPLPLPEGDPDLLTQGLEETPIATSPSAVELLDGLRSENADLKRTVSLLYQERTTTHEKLLLIKNVLLTLKGEKDALSEENSNLMDQNDTLQNDLYFCQKELDSAREEVARLRRELAALQQHVDDNIAPPVPSKPLADDSAQESDVPPYPLPRATAASPKVPAKPALRPPRSQSLRISPSKVAIASSSRSDELIPSVSRAEPEPRRSSASAGCSRSAFGVTAVGCTAYVGSARAAFGVTTVGRNDVVPDVSGVPEILERRDMSSSEDSETDETETSTDDHGEKLLMADETAPSADGSRMSESRTSVDRVGGLSLDLLIQNLCEGEGYVGRPDVEDAFLHTYRIFLPTEELIGKLTDVYAKHSVQPSSAAHLESAVAAKRLKDEAANKSRYRRRVLFFIERWHKKHPLDFAELALAHQQKYRIWADEEVRKQDGDYMARKIARFFPLECLTASQRVQASQPATLTSSGGKGTLRRRSKPAALPTSPPLKWTVVDIDAKEFARQLTLLDWNHFLLIHPSEYTGGAWTKEDKKMRAPRLLAMIRNFNCLSLLIQYTLCRIPDLKLRTAALEHIYDIAKWLRKFANFNSTLAFTSSMKSSPLYRLQKTKDRVSRKKSSGFDALTHTMSTDNGYALYRRDFAASPSPKIPYMGLILTDVTAVEEGMPKYIDGGEAINMDYCTRLAAQVRLVRDCQSTGSFTFQEVKSLQDWIMSSFTKVENLDEETLYDMSRAVEPKEDSRVFS